LFNIFKTINKHIIHITDKHLQAKSNTLKHRNKKMFKFFTSKNYDFISLSGQFLIKLQEKFIFLLQNA